MFKEGRTDINLAVSCLLSCEVPVQNVYPDTVPVPRYPDQSLPFNNEAANAWSNLCQSATAVAWSVPIIQCGRRLDGDQGADVAGPCPFGCWTDVVGTC